MAKAENFTIDLPEDLKKCVTFHGHLCPGLIYGYLVAKEATKLLELERSRDEEVVAVSENDSCAVDALQVLLGTSTGKGNLIIKNYGKNAYTILNRPSKNAYRFSRNTFYCYKGSHKNEFDMLEDTISRGAATEKEKKRQKLLKSEHLLSMPFDEVFSTKAVEFIMPPYAPLARSEPCAQCGEMTMLTKMIEGENGNPICIPCSQGHPAGSIDAG